MLLGAKLGDIWGRRRALVIGSIIYAIGSGTTALAPTMGVLFLGWSIIEGLGAVLVIPAVAALIADNYEGRDRITAFAVIGAVSGAAVAAGPLIGGFLTTYASWRYVFAGRGRHHDLRRDLRRPDRREERAAQDPDRRPERHPVGARSGRCRVRDAAEQDLGLDRAAALPRDQRGRADAAARDLATPRGSSRSGLVLLALFFRRQRKLVEAGREPLVHVDLLSIVRLRSGLTVLGAQYAITAGLFFMMPVYLQMTLGLDALQTGIRIFPLSVSLILFSAIGTRLSARWSPRRIVLIAQWILVASSVLLLGAVDPELSGWIFGIGMFTAGSALGLLASQLGNVNMSAVTEKDTSEVGGLQGVFQNLGSSLGTALIGSILIGALATSFASGVSTSALPDEVQTPRERGHFRGGRDRPRGERPADRGGRRPERGRRRRTREGVHRLAARGAAHRVLRADRAGAALAARFARHPGRSPAPQARGRERADRRPT